METAYPSSFQALVRELAADLGLGDLPTGVQRELFPVWRETREQEREAAVRKLGLPLLRCYEAGQLDAEPKSGLGGRRAGRKNKTGSREVVPGALDCAQAAVLAEHGWRAAEQDVGAQGGGRGWRDFPFRVVAEGKDAWTGRWEELDIDGRTLRLSAEPIRLEPPSEMPRSSVPGNLDLLVLHGRFMAMLYGWSEAEGVRFLMSGQRPRPRPLYARRIESVTGIRAASAVAILAGAHVDPNEVRRAFVEERRALLRSDASKGGGVPSLRNVELVRFVETWYAEHGSFDVDEVRAALEVHWKRRKGTRAWVGAIRHASRLLSDYTRNARRLLGRALKPGARPRAALENPRWIETAPPTGPVPVFEWPEGAVTHARELKPVAVPASEKSTRRRSARRGS